MIRVSQHAVVRFVQRYNNRGTAWSTKKERRNAEALLVQWFTNAIYTDADRYMYEDYIEAV